MSHITRMETTIRFLDESILKEALCQIGKVLEGNRAKTLVLNEGKIKSLSFLHDGKEWIARADNWGMEKEYKELIDRIQKQYVLTNSTRILKTMHYIPQKAAGQYQVIGRRY